MSLLKYRHSCEEWATRIMTTSLDDLRSPFFWRACVAECLGTLFLTIVGCGACVQWPDTSPTVVQISLAFGLSVATLVWILGSSSGGHINPAVSVAMLATGKISLVRTILYIFAQSGGAIVGAGILRGCTPNEQAVLGLGTTELGKHLTSAQGFGVEFLITFVLVFTVFATCDAKREDHGGSGPLAIGLSVAMCHLMAVKYTGSSMNPARSFGPAVITGRWTDHWIYWVGPMLGGTIAGILYEYVFAVEANLQRAKGYLLASQAELPPSDGSLDKRASREKTPPPRKMLDIEVVEDKTSSV